LGRGGNDSLPELASPRSWRSSSRGSEGLCIGEILLRDAVEVEDRF